MTKNKVRSMQILAGVFILAGSGAVSAQMNGALKDRAVSDAGALGLPGAALEVPAVNVPFPAAANYVFYPNPNALPENCTNMPVVYTKDNDIYKNGEKLGSDVSSYKGACSGDVAWRDSYGRIYRNKTQLGDSGQEFLIALYTGDVFWKDNYGNLHKNSAQIGNARTYAVADHTGDVAWLDDYGRLYRNGTQLGDASRYQITGHTGDVVWLDGYGTLHKNAEELGQSSNFMVADRTGDVAWMDHYSRLYLNKAQVSASCQSFNLREDGKLLWRDSNGDDHYQ